MPSILEVRSSESTTGLEMATVFYNARTLSVTEGAQNIQKLSFYIGLNSSDLLTAKDPLHLTLLLVVVMEGHSRTKSSYKGDNWISQAGGERTISGRCPKPQKNIHSKVWLPIPSAISYW